MKIKLRDMTIEQYNSWNILNCNGECENCIFHYTDCYTSSSGSWIKHKDLYSDKFLDQEIEVKEKPKLTEEEKIILKNFDNIENYKYIARDKSGDLYIYKNKPSKKTSTWDILDYSIFCHNLFPFSNLFNFIKWGNEEPYLISDLLEEDK